MLSCWLLKGEQQASTIRLCHVLKGLTPVVMKLSVTCRVSFCALDLGLGWSGAFVMGNI